MYIHIEPTTVNDNCVNIAHAQKRTQFVQMQNTPSIQLLSLPQQAKKASALEG
jgi:hypothetical protein